MNLGGALLAAATALAPTGCDNPGPAISSVVPAAARRGAVVAIGGEHFCGGDPGSSRTDAGEERCARAFAASVTFGRDLPVARAEILAWRDARIEAIVPTAAAPGASRIVVTVDGRSSNGVDFEVLP